MMENMVLEFIKDNSNGPPVLVEYDHEYICRQLQTFPNKETKENFFCPWIHSTQIPVFRKALCHGFAISGS